MLLLCCSPPENIQYFNSSKYSAASALLDLTPLFASIQIFRLSRFHSVVCYIDIGQVSQPQILHSLKPFCSEPILM